MGKLIQGRQVYDLVDLKLFYEREVQEQLASRAQLVFPGYLYAKFNAEIRSPHGTKKADFALIEEGYRAWYVGEVEKITHDLEGHVIPQVLAFRDGEYTDRHCELISQQNPAIDLARLKSLVATLPPTVYVMADRANSEWKTMIGFHRGIFGVFEIYQRRDVVDFAFRVNGQTPDDFSTLLSRCVPHRSIPRLMRLTTPSALTAAHKEKVMIEFGDAVSEWTVVRVGDSVQLDPGGGKLLTPGAEFDLHLAGDRLLLKKARAI